MTHCSESPRVVRDDGSSTAAQGRVISSLVKDRAIAEILCSLLNLKTLFLLLRSSKTLRENFRPFVLSILRRENAAVRLLRVCTRERHRRLAVDRSPTYSFDACMDPEFDEDQRSEIFQTFDYGTTMNFNMWVPKRPKHFQDFHHGPELTQYFQFTINSGPRDTEFDLCIYDCAHLRRHIRKVHFESDADLPQYQGEGEDFTFRTRRELHLIPCPGLLRYDIMHQVVLTLNNREWIGAVTIFQNGSRQYVFRFRRNANGTAHVLLLASDLVQYMSGFAPHAELGVDGMA